MVTRISAESFSPTGGVVISSMNLLKMQGYILIDVDQTASFSSSETKKYRGMINDS
jgi:hypothetical protein